MRTLAVVAVFLLAAPAVRADDAHAGGKLISRPHAPTARDAATGPGTHPLGLGEGGRDGLLRVPPGYKAGHPAPLLLLLHGATGSGAHILHKLEAAADKAGYLVLAPDSRGRTWDVLVERGYGSDVAFIDRALAQVFERYDVDPARVVVGGFSDGASYALSLGITNGKLFSRIVALSPGFAAPGAAEGKPRIFMAHGTQDSILPIDQASRQLVPPLRRAGYDVKYVEFEDDHLIREDILDAAFSWLDAKS